MYKVTVDTKLEKPNHQLGSPTGDRKVSVSRKSTLRTQWSSWLQAPLSSLFIVISHCDPLTPFLTLWRPPTITLFLLLPTNNPFKWLLYTWYRYLVSVLYWKMKTWPIPPKEGLKTYQTSQEWGSKPCGGLADKMVTPVRLRERKFSLFSWCPIPRTDEGTQGAWSQSHTLSGAHL